jgi:nicotinamide-nucleotide amidase
MSDTRDFVLPQALIDKAREIPSIRPRHWSISPRVIEERAAGRVAVAESCTGGLVAAALTEIAGSSRRVRGGFVTYSNEAKMELLDVSPEVIETFGSVSVAAAWAMARGASSRRMPTSPSRSPASPGPAGGTAKKPVGTGRLRPGGARRRPRPDHR